MGRVIRLIFRTLINIQYIQFACSRRTLLYLGHGTLTNMYASRAARKTGGGGGPQHPATMFYFDFFFLDSKIRGLKTFAKTCIIY